MDYSLTDLETFLTVAEQGSFSRAAEAMHVTQPVLSRRIRAMEARLGVSLFARTTRSVSLTPEGRVVLRHAQKILSSVQNLNLEISELKGSRLTIRLGYGSNAEFEMLTQLVEALHGSHPEVEIRIHRTGMMEALHQGLLDAALLMQCEADGQDWLSALPLDDSGLSCFFRRGDPLANSASVSLDAIRDARFILPIRHVIPENLSFQPLYDRIAETLCAHGVRESQIRMANGAQAFSVSILTGEGIGVMPDSSRVIESRSLIRRPIAECRSGFSIVLAWRREESRRKTVKLLLEAAEALTAGSPR